MATDIAIASLPNLPAASITGADIIPVVDVSDHTDPGGTTKGALVSALQAAASTQAGTINVVLQGADPSGGTDSTSVFTAALTVAASTGRTILIPPGTYTLTNLAWPNAQIIMQGSGMNSTILNFSANQGGGNLASLYLDHYVNTNGSRFSYLRDLQIVTVGGNTALRINNLGTHLSNVWCRGGAIGIEANSMVTAEWRNVIAYGSSQGCVLQNAGTSPSTNDIIWLNRFNGLSVSGNLVADHPVGLYAGANTGQNIFIAADAEQCSTGIRCIAGGLQRNTFVGPWCEFCTVQWVTEDSGCSNYWIDQYVRVADGLTQTFGITTGYQLGNIIAAPAMTSPVMTGTATIGGGIILTDAASKIVGGATSVAFWNHANSAANLTISDAGAATIRAGLTHGSATLLTTTTALTNGAAAQVATLTNGPAAGNPTKWIPVNDNGTTRYIPAW